MLSSTMEGREQCPICLKWYKNLLSNHLRDPTGSRRRANDELKKEDAARREAEARGSGSRRSSSNSSINSSSSDSSSSSSDSSSSGTRAGLDHDGR